MFRKLFTVIVLLTATKAAIARSEYRVPFYDKAMAQIMEPVLHLGQPAPIFFPVDGLVPVDADGRRRRRPSQQVHIPRTPEQQYTGLIVSGAVISGLGVGGMVLGGATLSNDSPDNPVSAGVLILGGILFLLGTGLLLGGLYIRSNYKKSVETTIDD
jgi:hypothetical protein